MRRGGPAPFGTFSLVGYLPPELAGFVESLRAELVPGCRARAHVTVLSPRPLRVPAAKAERELAAVLEEFSAFSVHLHEVCVFPATDVLYISVAGGAGELTRLHSTTNRKGVHFADPYAFHPHVTLAQETAPGGVAEARLHATRRWSSYAGPRDFLLDKLFLVECRSSNEFVDAAAFTLRVPLAMGVGGR